ncbi:FAD:protein FMN transferase [Ectothiorhodospiraceae bacterium BW-2]|nr:FAD:protein FMN transferase [Ectothiorhodospiraceae bacterium BW-2]
MRVVIVVGLLVWLLGCGEAEESRYQLYFFGTVIDMTLSSGSSSQRQQAVTAIKARFAHIHDDWHAWQLGKLTRLNQQLQQHGSAVLDPELKPLLQQSLALSALSGGRFDPTIGKLLQLWGFQQTLPPEGMPPPSEALLQQWLQQRPSSRDVVIEGERMTTTNRQLAFDMGAIAKGYAVDEAIDILRKHQIGAAIVNAGGDLRVIGRHGERPWRVGIRHPQGGGVLAALTAAGDESIFTSGNYERYREYEGVKYHHIIDPMTARPVEGVTSVTVIHRFGTVADAAATALVVAGVDHWPAVARAMGVEAVLLMSEAGVAYLTPAMAERIEWQTLPVEQVVVDVSTD